MFLEHANMTVSDLGRSVDFYSRLFGFQVRWEGEESGRPVAHVGDDRHYLALFQAASPGRVEKSMAEVGLNHLGFVVGDLEAMKSRLAELGVTPRAEHRYPPGCRFYFLDPDGIEVELIQY